MHIIEKDWTVGDYRAIVVMTDMGHRCGYIGVLKEHKAFGIEYYTLDIPLDKINAEVLEKIPAMQSVNNIEVHGGLTYASNSVLDINDGRWYFGYDCAHYNDTPEKCTLEYCVSECESLIKQLEDIK
jgi:hypothetical protein